MKRAIVTGATGMIASALIRLLVSKGVEVYALCRPGDDKNDEFFNSPLVHAVDADISDLVSAKEKIDQSCDVLYHFAWLGTFGNSRGDAYVQSDNIKYTLDAVTLASETGCKCFVSSGSQAEYGRTEEKLTGATPVNPETGYGIAKFASGKLSRIYANQLGIRHCWVRILSVFGQKGNPNSIIMSSLDKMLKGEYTSFTKGEQQWDFLHCDDAALALYLIGEKGKDGKVYPLGSGETRLLKDYIIAMRDCVNPELKVGIGDLPYNEGQVMYLCADISELTEDTGFKPSLTFEEGIIRTAQWMKGERK
ncbi:MAG: NAD(P)-dependent oxidoreductase [Clostridiales bacterium]|nr:NAD(P)-dependent oxidoreductase [Clostridiales bacterium]